MKQNSKKRIALMSVLIIVVAAALYLPTKAVIRHSVECRNKHNALLTQNQPTINEFNEVEVLSNQQPKPADVKVSGGCDGLNPLGITIKKEYELNISGSEIVDSVRNRLKSTGYVLTREDFGSEGCKAIYRAEAKNEKIKIYVAAHQNEQGHRIIGCTDGYPTGISEGVFRKQTIDGVLVTPKS